MRLKPLIPLILGPFFIVSLVYGQAGGLQVTIVAPPDEAQLTVNVPVTFVGSASGGNGFYTYIWNFGDGTQGGGREFTKTYRQTGRFRVTLTVGDTAGNQGSTFIQVNVNEPPPPPDTTPPTPPSITFSSHQPGVATTSPTVVLRWSQSVDNQSGLAGYSFVFDNQSATTPDNLVETTATGTSRTLTVGTWFFHLVAVDRVGNRSTPTTHFGPLIIQAGGDQRPVISNLRVTDITATSVIIRWQTDRLADSRVIYDTVSRPDISNQSPPNFGYAFSTPRQDEQGVTDHAVQISGLSPSTTYYFRALSRSVTP